MSVWIKIIYVQYRYFNKKVQVVILRTVTKLSFEAFLMEYYNNTY